MADGRPVRWDAVTRLTLHPTKVLIIEALADAVRPVSPSELTSVLTPRNPELTVEKVYYHVVSLAESGVIAAAEDPEMPQEVSRPGNFTKTFYVLAPAVTA